MKTKILFTVLGLLLSFTLFAQEDADVPSRDQTIVDDLIVKGSLGVGYDIPTNHNFGFSTVVLSENNTRLRFWDTSSSSSFPSNDWELVANETSNGGLNHFSIFDVDHNKTPFRVLAGAPSYSLFVNSIGRVGFGTSTPITTMHAKAGNTPTLRLEQDGSQGWSAHTWDVGANETNFFIRDATNGNNLPFRIRAGAPNSSLYVANDGDVGLKTSTPDGLFDVASSSNPNDHAFLIATNGNVGINIPNGFAPESTLDVNGGIKIGNTTTANSGVIRWTGSDFEGFTGGAWESLTSGSGSSDTDDQTLSTNGAAGDISIEDGNNITLNVDDADASATNELQNVSDSLNLPNLTTNNVPYWNHQFEDSPIQTDGTKIGVGTTSLSATLTVQNNGSTYGSGIWLYDNGDANAWTRFNMSNSNTDYGVIQYLDASGNYNFRLNNPGGSGGTLKFVNNSNSGIEFYTEGTSFSDVKMKIQADGNVGIGTTSPDEKLAVNGNIKCAELIVTSKGWPDYVFDKDYDLKSLEEVEAFINENKHLPGVPAEQKIIEEGVNVGDMNEILLKKIEELTLYMIELKKENKEMKSQIEELEKK